MESLDRDEMITGWKVFQLAFTLKGTKESTERQAFLVLTLTCLSAFLFSLLTTWGTYGPKLLLKISGLHRVAMSLNTMMRYEFYFAFLTLRYLPGCFRLLV